MDSHGPQPEQLTCLGKIIAQCFRNHHNCHRKRRDNTSDYRMFQILTQGIRMQNEANDHDAKQDRCN